MQNQKLKKTKDSLLIGKNSRFSSEICDKARVRAIYSIVGECLCMIAYIVFIAYFMIEHTFKYYLLGVALLFVLIEIVDQSFTIHALVFFKDSLLTKSSNLSIIAYIPLVICLVLMYLDNQSFQWFISTQIVILGMSLILCFVEQYLIRRFNLLDYIKTKQRYNIKAALYNRKSFEDTLCKSVASKSGEELV